MNILHQERTCIPDATLKISGLCRRPGPIGYDCGICMRCISQLGDANAGHDLSMLQSLPKPFTERDSLRRDSAYEGQCVQSLRQLAFNFSYRSPGMYRFSRPASPRVCLRILLTKKVICAGESESVLSEIPSIRPSSLRALKITYT
ncbi:uncharacterized protein BT62DRAFT_1071046 [Guyanagaster necrorhizus]|uniref:Uncharacterized protein n=1 Tax=Guyanagaster necrorhizus TaxID=856835 RepID=A0A9P8AXP9_9AGAR|nr:uncharacterized protein BT62DRAFT_1071046 [Guyanagaster necrorhizus MCA 3950]KAG7451833.1 hypothetical protein BT62DRAFT_1071046 [Guyanagaster necrorhizus MCA 3950]